MPITLRLCQALRQPRLNLYAQNVRRRRLFPTPAKSPQRLKETRDIDRLQDEKTRGPASERKQTESNKRAASQGGRAIAVVRECRKSRATRSQRQLGSQHSAEIQARPGQQRSYQTL